MSASGDKRSVSVIAQLAREQWMSGTSYRENRERPMFGRRRLAASFSLRGALPPPVKGAEMGWFNFFSPTEAGAAANASDMTIFNGTFQNGANRSVVVRSAMPDAPDPPPSEEIKRRQVALILRYVTAIRAR